MTERKKIWRVRKEGLDVRLYAIRDGKWSTMDRLPHADIDHLFEERYLHRETQLTFITSHSGRAQDAYRQRKDDYIWCKSEAEALALLAELSRHLSERLTDAAEHLHQITCRLTERLTEGSK